MANLDIIQVQIIAMSSVENPTWKSQYRSICRWFSREFSTPIDVVENDLDVVYVLTHYYESSFSQLKESGSEDSNTKYEEIKDELLLSRMPESAVLAAEAEDDDWEAEMQAEIAESLRKQKEKEEVEKKEVDTAEELKDPNLNDELEFTVQGE